MDIDVPPSKKQKQTNEESEKQPTGKIVGIIKRNWRPYCGTISVTKPIGTTMSSSTTQSVFFWAFDKRIPKIRIRTRQAHNLAGKRIMVSIDSWSTQSKHPNGHFVKVLGEVGDREVETELLLLEHDVPYAPFPPTVLSCLPKKGADWVVVDEVDLKDREDFRSMETICSIDPPGCTDIDDALHAKLMENGNYEVGVRKILRNKLICLLKR